ncbi:hypothetical protein [Nostoc sp.]|uniref:hypothetical protein n=1 Tax=Nostoc sp. TaxID=1180 RepID=UPI002FF3C167
MLSNKKLRRIVGWVKQSVTQQSYENVGFLHNLRFLALTELHCTMGIGDRCDRS